LLGDKTNVFLVALISAPPKVWHFWIDAREQPNKGMRKKGKKLDL